MPRRILILDDDGDFNTLLTDVFSQADYEVVSSHDPREALELARQQKFDVVVSDFKMPGMTGMEFYQALRAERPHLPFIIVSGYLENDTIRSFINEGVRGIFLKPLNIFSLLKKVQEIFEDSPPVDRREETSGGGRESAAESAPATQGTPGGLQLRSFACVEPATKSFAERIHKLRHFKSNLLLVAPEGTDMEAVCEDLRHFEDSERQAVLALDDALLKPSALRARLDELAAEGYPLVTVLIRQTESLSAEQQRCLFDLGKGQGDFADLSLRARLVFGLSEDLDSLYENSRIDDSLYLFLGTNEVKVPALGGCSEEISALARRRLRALMEAGRVGHLRFDAEAQNALKQMNLPGNHRELYGLVSRVAAQVREGVIGAADLESAGGSAAQLLHAAQQREKRGLENFLATVRDEIVRAAVLLCEGDSEIAAGLLGVEAGWVKGRLENRPGSLVRA